MQEKTELLTTVSTQLGLNINRSKTKVMKANKKNNNPITMKGDPLEERKTETEFTYLGSTINKNGGRGEDVKARILKARVVFIMLITIWGAKQDTKRIQNFIKESLCRILHLKWTDKVSNITLWKWTKQLLIENEIKKRKWRWTHSGNLKKPSPVRPSHGTPPRPGKRRRGRPRNTWRREKGKQKR
ncbi:hypothetical protein NP493_232g00024 [Ridgeia piscesae]|uniref:Reverse transcriptase domain-containing protein n=1 Tax=Ridgeia piscesae TaxID=27915 RepID=A0AAD9NZS4_RIDPI|nr:hypothetical protein NP493_232g00024 [Ridgeia piscesae]